MAGWLSDAGIRLALVGVFLVAYALLFHGQLGWDRLLWKAGPGTSNMKNNHSWGIRTIMYFSVPLHSRSVCHAEVKLDCVALFGCLSIIGLTHTNVVSLGKALVLNTILTSVNHLLSVRVSTLETEEIKSISRPSAACFLGYRLDHLQYHVDSASSAKRSEAIFRRCLNT